MLRIASRTFANLLAVSLLGAASIGLAQTSNATVDGLITDPKGAVVAGARVVLTSKDTSQASTFVSDSNGLYTFRNVLPGTYQLAVTALGFGQYVQEGILVRIGYPIRLNIEMKLVATTVRVEVAADASPLNFENAEIRGSIDPQEIQDVPLLVSGSLRSAGNFASLLPGVVRGSGDVSGAHVSGGQAQTGIVILDGISLYNSSGTPGLTGAVLDFPQSPDIISEFQVLTSNYDARYGSASGVTVENVRSGTNAYHGTAYEFNRNTSFNAIAWGQAKSPDIENDFGANFGGPLKLPFWNDKDHRTFFFANFEGFRIRGALSRPTVSIPSMAERNGDFSDWIDPNTGNLIPVYDPATHQQFMGCNGNTPNVICSTDPRLQNSLAKQWFQYLPTPTSPGPTNNYLAPAQPAFLGTDADSVTEKIDEYIGSKDHISEMFYYKYLPRTTFTTLPAVISDSGTSFKRTSVFRANWDHTFTPNIVNHVAFGFQDDKYYGGGIDGPYADKLPQIPGVASHVYPPQITFEHGSTFQGFGTGAGDPNLQPWLAPAWIVNDAVSMTRGKHTLSFGGDLRFSQNSLVTLGQQSGVFDFQRGETGIPSEVSGSPIASFLLEQVDNSQTNFYTSTNIDAHIRSYAFFAGDTWRVTPKLTVSPGLHWEVDPPPFEARNHFSYFDPTLPNPGAGNLLGAIAFAGSGPGRSGRRIPEDIWYGGIAPRIGVAYALTAKTVIRSGYGLFYDNANMPGWAGGISQDGYNASVYFSAPPDQQQPAFLLSDGLPSNHAVPPDLVSTFDNGQNAPVYRARTANRLPYSQQWNLTVENQFTDRDYISVSYVGTKGTRLLSDIAPINVVNPSYLSMGSKLFDTFGPNDTQVDGVPLPYAGFADSPCVASVAQALLPFPQYCNNIQGLNENKGSSTYHSLQLKAEHRFSKGIWALLSYTNSKLITDADNGESILNPTYFSPYEVKRNRSLALEDVPQVLNVAFTYELPFGHNKRWLSSGVAGVLAGGWKFNGVYRVQSGIPFQIFSSYCNVPSQFIRFCSPALLPGKSPFLQNPSHFDKNLPVLDVQAFEPASSFNFYTGSGPRVQNFRQPGFSDFDLGLNKSVHLTERLTFEFRADAFNLFNAHHFNSVGAFIQSSGTGGSAFDTNVADPAFGTWNGGVSSPRNLQLSGRISF